MVNDKHDLLIEYGHVRQGSVQRLLAKLGGLETSINQMRSVLNLGNRVKLSLLSFSAEQTYP